MKPYYKTDIRCKRGYKTKRTSQREVRRLEAATLGKVENRISYNAGKKLQYTKNLRCAKLLTAGLRSIDKLDTSHQREGQSKRKS